MYQPPQNPIWPTKGIQPSDQPSLKLSKGGMTSWQWSVNSSWRDQKGSDFGKQTGCELNCSPCKEISTQEHWYLHIALKHEHDTWSSGIQRYRAYKSENTEIRTSGKVPGFIGVPGPSITHGPLDSMGLFCCPTDLILWPYWPAILIIPTIAWECEKLGRNSNTIPSLYGNVSNCW